MKIVDRREIEFNASSVVRALSMSTRAARGFGLPALAPAGIRFHPDTSTVDVLYGLEPTRWAVSIPSEALGAILVSYCVRARIPMPRKSNKTIRIEEGSIVLAFRTGYEEPPAPGFPTVGPSVLNPGTAS